MRKVFLPARYLRSFSVQKRAQNRHRLPLLLTFAVISMMQRSVASFSILTRSGLKTSSRQVSFLRMSSSGLKEQSHSASCSSSSSDDALLRRQRLLEESSRLSLAPMMEYTDRHFRHLVRLISKRTLVYTEMVAANAIAHERNDAMQRWIVESNSDMATDNNDDDLVRTNYDDRFLRRYLSQANVEPGEGASVLQLGGSSPDQLFQTAQTVMDMEMRGFCNYTAINLNCGCPSPKIAGKGCFGASLMADPALVAALTTAIYNGCDGRMPVTVKCRIGTDTPQMPYSALSYAQLDPEEEYRKLCHFIEAVASAGVVTDIQVHARIAVLSKSFSPADNRKVPPLKYELVRRLVKDYPELTFSLNGGINSITQAMVELDQCPGLAGVMVGRAWAASPWNFAMADRLLYGDKSTASSSLNRLQILEAYGKHADYEESIWDPVKIRRFIVKAVTPLFAGEPNAKRYRIALDKVAGSAKELHLQGKSTKSQPPLSELLLATALEHLSEETLMRSPQESYEHLLYEQRKCVSPSATRFVSEWQDQRKTAELT